MKVTVGCPYCGKMVQIDNVWNAVNLSGKHTVTCPACSFSFKIIVNKGTVCGSER